MTLRIMGAFPLDEFQDDPDKRRELWGAYSAAYDAGLQIEQRLIFRFGAIVSSAYYSHGLDGERLIYTVINSENMIFPTMV